MGHEVELKLALPEGEQRRLLRSPLLREAASRRNERLVNIYYDTPDLALHCNGIALRLRRSRRRWLQTIKCAGLSQGGLSSRPEWEGQYGGSFDFDAVTDARTRKLLERFKSRLVPVFETNFMRTTWIIHATNADLLLMLDHGDISAGGRTSVISEVEIELAGGSVDDIFLLADRLAQGFSLNPTPRSKAERGYALFTGKKEMPVNAAPVMVDSAMKPIEAFRQIALAGLDHLQLNHHGSVHSDNAEYIHQMRVALRRLRASFRLFQPLLPVNFCEHLLPPLHDLMRVLGTTRDLDVLTDEIVDPVMVAIPAEPRIADLAGAVAAQRRKARLLAIETLNDPAYGHFVLQAMRAVNQLLPGNEVTSNQFAEFANQRLRHLQRKMLHLAQVARQDDPASLHALRIGAKRLRYALDFLSPLLPAQRTAKLARQLARLQNSLGQLNDLANAGTLLMACADDDPGLREAVSLIGGWHGKRYARLLASVPGAVEKLQNARLPKVEK